MSVRSTFAWGIGVPILADQRLHIARLFSFLVLAERVAHHCALGQASVVEHVATRRFLLAQSRQEAFHACVFQSAMHWLAPRGITNEAAARPIARYQALLRDAIRRRDFVETVLAQQVILEGLGEVVLSSISAGIAQRGLGFARLRRTLLTQEHAHHTFGLRQLHQLTAADGTLVVALRERGLEYLALTDDILAVLADLFEVFDEDPAAYASAARRRLPNWITETR